MSNEKKAPDDAIIVYKPDDPVQLKVAAIAAAVGKKKGDVEAALPRGIEYGFWLRSVQTAFIENPDLLGCTGASLMKAVMNSAYVGLPPNKQLSLAAFVQFKDECVYMPMVQGLVKLALMHPSIKDIQTSVVYEGDEFSYQRGTEPMIRHVPARRARGDAPAIEAAYSIAWMANGALSFEVLEAADIAKVRGVAKTDKVWSVWGGEMARKAAFRRHRKWLPTSSELLRAIEIDEEAVLDTTATVAPAQGAGMAALAARIAPPAVEPQPDPPAPEAEADAPPADGLFDDAAAPGRSVPS